MDVTSIPSNEKTAWLRTFTWGLFLLIFWPFSLYAEETYTFDLSEIEKKPWHIGGYAEIKPTLSWPGEDSALYRLKYYNRDVGKVLDEYNFKLQLEGSFEKEIARLYFKTNTDYKTSRLGDKEKTDLYEGVPVPEPLILLEGRCGKENLEVGEGIRLEPRGVYRQTQGPGRSRSRHGRGLRPVRRLYEKLRRAAENRFPHTGPAPRLRSHQRGTREKRLPQRGRETLPAFL